ncbi:MAG: MBL fold metallo-hydrolase RNA specificity domain-containing protein [Pirellulales bacterium]
MFHYDNGLVLTRGRLAVDFRRRQPCGFVSHAHADHMARHELALATPATARLYRHRLGDRLRVLEMPYRAPLEFGGLRLTAYPAGHCLGSAMLLADDGDTRLLYTGDFKLAASLTAEPAELPHADILVMESTFGLPRYRLPRRDSVIEQLLAEVRTALASAQTPVIHAYALGKAQEVTKILTTAGISVQQHPVTYAVSRVYAACGMDLGSDTATVGEYTDRPLAGHAVVTLPRGMKNHRLPGLGATRSIAVTGWANDSGARYRLGVDVALPLSDHADFDDLCAAVAQVNPRQVFCTHGPREFVDHLRSAGFDAQPLSPDRQRQLF